MTAPSRGWWRGWIAKGRVGRRAAGGVRTAGLRRIDEAPMRHRRRISSFLPRAWPLHAALLGALVFACTGKIGDAGSLAANGGPRAHPSLHGSAPGSSAARADPPPANPLQPPPPALYLPNAK